MDILGYVPSFGGLLHTVLAFVVALSIIVAVHEYGHYIVGRWSGIHAEVFSLGFGPRLFSFTDRHGTRWQLAALPFGGYVKFLGDADPASGKDGETIYKMSPEERRHTMHGAPLWARAATVLAGPMFNFMLSILVFAGFFLVKGIATDLPVVGAMKSTPFAAQSLLPGDRVLAINGAKTPDLEQFLVVAGAVSPEPSVTYTVMRNGAEVTVEGPFPFPPIADSVTPKSAAMDAGLLNGDVVLSVNGRPIDAFSQLRDSVGGSDGAPVALSIWREGGVHDVTLIPKPTDLPKADGGFETRWLIGLSGGLVFAPETRTPGPMEAISLGAQQTWFVVKISLSGIWHVITGAISTCNLQGPLGIAESSGAAASQGVGDFISFIALLSTAVGLLNLFPVPVLDGGHLVFHAWEAVTGRPPSDKALNRMMLAGLALLLTMMVFALSNDLFCP